MKLTTLILITVILHVSATTLAQKVTLNEKNARLVDVFNDINAQTGYDFVFTTTIVKDAKPVTINVKNEELNDALTQIFQGQDLDFSLDNKIVVIKAKETSLLGELKNKIKAELLQTTVTGKVIDLTGQPIPGVNVREKGTQNGTVTDNKGAYSITVTDNKSIITFSYIGYETQELAASAIPNGSVIKLKASSENLREVVISKGYYDEKSELSTSDISVVDAKTIEEQPVSDPIQALIGRVPGLNIQQSSGIPGSNETIRIRGINSIGNGNAPFYVVDGVPFNSSTLTSPTIGGGALGYPTGTNASSATNSNGVSLAGGLSPFNILNPDDIESIEVLKDADATSIYGSRGANGVILITTKKGKVGETKVNFDLSQGIGQVGHFMDLLNTQQYLQMEHQAYKNDGLSFPSIQSNPQDNHYYINGFWDTTRNTNWQKVLIGNTAHYTNAQGSISGGNANTQFLIGGGYNRQTTVFPGDYGDKKGSFHFSLTNTSSNQKFHAVLTASYGYENNNVPDGDRTSQITLPPDAPALHNPDGTLNWQLYNGNATFGNPLSASVISFLSVTNNLVSNLNLSYQLLPGLVLQSSFGYNHGEMNQTQLTPASSAAPPYGEADPSNRQSQFAQTFSQGWIIEPQISYQKKIGKATLNILLGGTLQQTSSQSSSMSVYDFASDALISDPTAGTIYANGYETSLDRYEAAIARISYTWDDKYLLNLTANRDGSSRFGPGRQFANFGAVGAGWIFSKEKAVQDVAPWLSFGKLRASYGSSGNDQIGDYQFLNTYSINSGISYQGQNSLTPNGLTNPYFAWEVDKKLEGAIELGFLKDRINLSLDYYRNRTGNQLTSYPLPTTTGFQSIEYNLPAIVQNTGLEIELHTVNFKTKDFTWSTSVNFTLPQNKLVSFPGLAASGYSESLVVGKSLFITELNQYKGVNPQTGLYTFITQNTNGIPSFPQDAAFSDALTQKYYGGMQNSFSYKGFSLDIFIQAVKQIGFNYQDYFGAPGFNGKNEPTAVLGAWQTPGQAATTQVYSTRITPLLSYLSFSRSTGMLTDASFIRLKNVALSYKLPVQWQQWAHMQNARVYFSGENLFTVTKYIGLDPETQGLGLPPLRIMTMGVSASF